MLMPRKTKYRKVQRGTMRGMSKGARTLKFGDYGLVAVDPGWLTAQQIESMRIVLSRQLRKVGKPFLRVFPDKPITKKPAEVRMGGGKGAPEAWVAVIKRGRVICEVTGLQEEEAKKVLKAASYKIPMKTKMIKNDL